MGILSWIVIGGLAGLAARFVMKRHLGLIVTIIVGIIGAVAGGWVLTAVTNGPGSRGSLSGASWSRSPEPSCCSTSTVSSRAEEEGRGSGGWGASGPSGDRLRWQPKDEGQDGFH